MERETGRDRRGGEDTVRDGRSAPQGCPPLSPPPTTQAPLWPSRPLHPLNSWCVPHLVLCAGGPCGSTSTLGLGNLPGDLGDLGGLCLHGGRGIPVGKSQLGVDSVYGDPSLPTHARTRKHTERGGGDVIFSTKHKTHIFPYFNISEISILTSLASHSLLGRTVFFHSSL